MRRLLIGLGFVLVTATAAQAQTLNARPGDWLVWDFPQGETVARFEMRQDSPTFASIGLPAPSNDGQTAAGHNSYAWQIPLNATLTTHTYAVRACHATGCGAELAGSVALTAPLPSRPSNGFRIRPATQGGLVLLPPGVER